MRFIYTRAFAIFAGCLIIIVIGLFLQVRGLLQPIEYGLLQAPRPFVSAGKAVTSPVRNFFATLFTVRRIVKQNIDLENKVADLQQQVVNEDVTKAENAVLKQELKFTQVSGLNLQPCTILSVDPETVTDTFIINCGQGQGITEGQAVVAQGHLVGKVINVGKLTSTALFVTDANSSIDAAIRRSGTEGVVKGSFGSGVVLDMVPQNADLQKGDIVVTAGINSRIAKNIIIGEVGDVLSKPNDLFKRVSLVSPVRYHELQYIFVAKQ